MRNEIILTVLLSVVTNLLITYMLYRFNYWRMRGEIGYTGAKGDRGPEGKSAYGLAIEEGFEGTLEEFLKTGFVKPKQYLHNDIEGRSTTKTVEETVLSHTFYTRSQWIPSDKASLCSVQIRGNGFEFIMSADRRRIVGGTAMIADGAIIENDPVVLREFNNAIVDMHPHMAAELRISLYTAVPITVVDRYNLQAFPFINIDSMEVDWYVQNSFLNIIGYKEI